MEPCLVVETSLSSRRSQSGSRFPEPQPPIFITGEHRSCHWDFLSLIQRTGSTFSALWDPLLSKAHIPAGRGLQCKGEGGRPSSHAVIGHRPHPTPKDLPSGCEMGLSLGCGDIS